jgi:dihydrofolate synthase/folylpolyglutamate synthase
MLAKLSPIIDRWYFCDLPTARAASAPQVQSQWQAQNSRKDAASSCHSSPQAALDAAFAAAGAADRIVVFGSFYTVGGVLQNGEPRPPAPHLPASPALPTAPNT